MAFVQPHFGGIAPMRPFKSDFYRSFAIGFVLGGLAVWAQIGHSQESMVPTAIAAPADR